MITPKARLTAALSGLVGEKLAEELISDFLKLRQDYATRTLERASPGKFVETFMQCLQQMGGGFYDASPCKVDDFFDKQALHMTALPEDLRICAARIARSIYTLRNKRNVAHKGHVDPNSFDLAYAHDGARWIVAEMLRCATGITMQQAGELIELIHAPVGSLVEEIEGVRLVHGAASLRAELLILLHSIFPVRMALPSILASLNTRNPGSVKNKLRDLVDEKLAFGDSRTGYRLTQAGHAAAAAEIVQAIAQRAA